MKKLLLAALLCLAPFSAQAATCYWVAGTSYNAATSWSSSTGGSPSTCAATSGIPKNAGDIATLDANSPAATTLTLDVDIASIATIDMRNLTGSSGFDFSTHNVTFTTSFLATNAATTRTLSLGSGTITLGNGALWNNLSTTGETFNKGTATIVFAGGFTSIQFFGGGKTYSTCTFNANSSAAYYALEIGSNASLTCDTLNITAPANIQFGAAFTLAATNAFNITGTAANPIFFSTSSSSFSAFNLSAGAASTCVWCVFRGVNGTTSTITATNSLGLGNNSGTLSISNPTAGGGTSGYIIGGQ